VSGRAGLVVTEEVRIYDHGPQHPLRPERVLLTWSLIDAYGFHASPQVVRLEPTAAGDDALALVHDRAFIDATRRAGHGEDGPWGAFGYGPGDNPIFDRMHEAGAIVVGGTVEAARSVLSGDVEHAFNAPGGLHHAMPARASGFCVYDDPAVAIAWLLSRGVERVVYVDVDVHHGDGPQAIFWNEPRVLTCSIHQYAPCYFFPGTGDAAERGGPEAEGSAINVPLAPNTSEDEWLAAFGEAVLPPVRAFRPDVLVTQLGCDTHRSDPLAQLELTTRAYREVAAQLHLLAHEAAGGRWIATGGGGYQWASVVPRAWTLYFAEMADVEIDDSLPRAWLDEAERLAGAALPTSMSER
jgi:acetoin utilization protein AcuC